MSKIIAYSLFIMDDCHPYDIKLYKTGVMANYIKMKELAPDFKMVLYHDKTVDISDFHPDIELIKIKHNRHNTFYMTHARFLAFSYPDAELVLIRDLDNMLSEEDFRVISRWMKRSKTCFHRYVLKGYGRNLVASGIAFRPQLFSGYLFTEHDFKNLKGLFEYGCDEEYLDNYIYPRIQESLTTTEVIPGKYTYRGYLKCSDNVFPMRSIQPFDQ